MIVRQYVYSSLVICNDQMPLKNFIISVGMCSEVCLNVHSMISKNTVD